MLSSEAVVSSESKYFSPGSLLIDNNQPLGKGPRHLLGANLPVTIGGEGEAAKGAVFSGDWIGCLKNKVLCVCVLRALHFILFFIFLFFPVETSK